MTPAGLRALNDMAALQDAGEDGAILCSGIVCYIGHRQISRRTVTALLQCLAVKVDSYDKAEYFHLNETGRAIIRRPALADEVTIAVLKGVNFTIRNDRIVPMKRGRP